MIPVYSGGRWRVERILYGSRDLNANTFTVATNGRGNFNTGPSLGVGYDINVVTGSYTSSGTLCTVNTSGAHNYITGMSVYLKHTSGTGFDGSYKVNVTSTTQFTVEYPFARTTSGSISILPEIRLRSL